MLGKYALRENGGGGGEGHTDFIVRPTWTSYALCALDPKPTYPLMI